MFVSRSNPKTGTIIAKQSKNATRAEYFLVHRYEYLKLRHPSIFLARQSDAIIISPAEELGFLFLKFLGSRGECGKTNEHERGLKPTWAITITRLHLLTSQRAHHPLLYECSRRRRRRPVYETPPMRRRGSNCVPSPLSSPLADSRRGK